MRRLTMRIALVPFVCAASTLIVVFLNRDDGKKDDVFISLILKKVGKNSMFKRMTNSITDSKAVILTIEGKEIAASQGDTVAVAMLIAGFKYTRITPEEEKRRAPYCMMGICFDCIVEINGIPNQRACQTLVQDGMRVNIQDKGESLNI